MVSVDGDYMLLIMTEFNVYVTYLKSYLRLNTIVCMTSLWKMTYVLFW